MCHLAISTSQSCVTVWSSPCSMIFSRSRFTIRILLRGSQGQNLFPKCLRPGIHGCCRKYLAGDLRSCIICNCSNDWELSTKSTIRNMVLRLGNAESKVINADIWHQISSYSSRSMRQIAIECTWVCPCWIRISVVLRYLYPARDRGLLIFHELCVQTPLIQWRYSKCTWCCRYCDWSGRYIDWQLHLSQTHR